MTFLNVIKFSFWHFPDFVLYYFDAKSTIHTHYMVHELDACHPRPDKSLSLERVLMHRIGEMSIFDGILMCVQWDGVNNVYPDRAKFSGLYDNRQGKEWTVHDQILKGKQPGSGSCINCILTWSDLFMYFHCLKSSSNTDRRILRTVKITGSTDDSLAKRTKRATIN